MWRPNPIVYEINTRVWLAELSRVFGRSITLANVPEEEIRRLEQYALDAIWLMGVWAPSPVSRQIARTHPSMRADLARILPGLGDEDVVASPFAVYDYSVSKHLGGEAGLRAFRERLARNGLLLMLDFVPNHLAMDHPWTAIHPDYLVHREHQGRAETPGGPHTPGDTAFFTREVDGRLVDFAHGRDPYFPPWSDTVQVDYNNPAARSAMIATLQDIADRCDGVRCDMAMLVTNGVFRQVWGGREGAPFPAGEFWEAAISAVKSRHPGFLFLAEVYWAMERQLQQLGFDYTYDKGLYDLLRAQNVGGARDHLRLDRGFQARMARFIENHDEPRAAEAFGDERSRAAALLVATLPGLRLFHQGQFEGRRIRLPVQLGRLPREENSSSLEAFYQRLLSLVDRDVFHAGNWQLLDPSVAWAGNGSFSNILAYTWSTEDKVAVLVAVNLGGHRSQTRVRLTWPGWVGRTWTLREILDERPAGPAVYHRDGDRLVADGLFVDLEPGGYHVLSVEAAENAPS